MNQKIRAPRSIPTIRSRRPGFIYGVAAIRAAVSAAAATLLGAAAIATTACSTLHRDGVFLLAHPEAGGDARALCFDHLENPGRAHPLMLVCGEGSARKGCRPRGAFGETIEVKFGGHGLLLELEVDRGFASAGPLIFPIVPTRFGPGQPGRLAMRVDPRGDDSVGVDKSQFRLVLADGSLPLVPLPASRAAPGAGARELEFELPANIPDEFRIVVAGVTVDDVPQAPRAVPIRFVKRWLFELPFSGSAAPDDPKHAGQAPCGH